MTDSTVLANRFRIINLGFGFFRRRGGLSALGLLTIFIFSQGLFADAPATQSANDDTPQAFLAHTTNDVVAAMTVDQVMALIAFSPDSNPQRGSAKLMAACSIEGGKLEVAVREKWGKEAEIAVAHAVADNMPDDAATAVWAINGDKAVATFKNDNLGPAMLMKQDGHWKIDIEAYRGDIARDTFDKGMQDVTAMFDQLIQDLAKKDTNADAFTQHVKDEMDKHNGGYANPPAGNGN